MVSVPCDRLPDVSAELEQVVADVFPEETACGSGGSDVGGVTGAWQAAMDNLRGMHCENTGSTAYRFSTGGLLAALKFASRLRPSVSIGKALADAADMFFGAESRPMQRDLRDGVVPLPSVGTFRMARVKLDILPIMYERQLLVEWRYLRYFQVDSSPQLGFNFLCCREDRLRFPVVAGVDIFAAGFDLSSVCETRLCPLSVIGHRNAKLAKQKR